MPVSLTREEFVRRLAQREKLFNISLERICEQNPLKVEVSFKDAQTPQVNTVELVKTCTGIISACISRAINLVYNEDLD